MVWKEKYFFRVSWENGITFRPDRWIISFLVSYQVVYYFNLVFITYLDSSKYLGDWKQFRCYTFFLAKSHLVLSSYKSIVNVPHPSKRKFLYLHWNDEIKNCDVFDINDKFSFEDTLCRKTYDVLFSVLPPIIITSVPYVIVIKLIRPCLSWPKFFHTSFSKIAIVFLGNSFLSQHPPRMKTLPGLATGNEFWILFKRTFHTKKRWLQPMTETITESIFEVTDFVWVIYTIYSQIPFISCAKIKY